METDTLKGVADYLITPRQAYIETPLLCVAEAKKDDFVRGAAQCLAEMVACRQNNQSAGYKIDIFGIVSNGQDWKFYKLTQTPEIFETPPYDRTYLPELLGVLDAICAECTKNVP